MKKSSIEWLVSGGLVVGGIIANYICKDKIEKIENDETLTAEEKKKKELPLKIIPAAMFVGGFGTTIAAACTASNEYMKEYNARLATQKLENEAISATEWEMEEAIKTTVFPSKDPTSDKFLSVSFNEWTGEKTAFIGVPLRDVDFTYDDTQYPLDDLTTTSAVELSNFDFSRPDYKFTEI